MRSKRCGTEAILTGIDRPCAQWGIAKCGITSAAELDYEEMISKAVIATGQLAKRQMTWLRQETEAQWFDALEHKLFSKAITYIKSVLMTT